MTDVQDELPELPESYEDARPRRNRLAIAAAVGCGLLVTLPILILAVYGILMTLGVFPDSKAVPGSRVEARLRPFLATHGLLDPDEHIVYYYSDAVFSYEEDGNYFTDKRAVSYWTDEDEFCVEAAMFDEIIGIYGDMSEGLLENAMITIERKGGGEFTLWVSGEAGGDDEFLRLLKQRWRAATKVDQPQGSGK
ncbi:MAG: hypothetical protein AAF581_19795 [Planctomycetota bacterium]